MRGDSEDESELSTGELSPVAIVSSDIVDRLVKMELGESKMLSSSPLVMSEWYSDFDESERS